MSDDFENVVDSFEARIINSQLTSSTEIILIFYDTNAVTSKTRIVREIIEPPAIAIEQREDKARVKREFKQRVVANIRRLIFDRHDAITRSGTWYIRTIELEIKQPEPDPNASSDASDFYDI